MLFWWVGEKGFFGVFLFVCGEWFGKWLGKKVDGGEGLLICFSFNLNKKLINKNVYFFNAK